MREPDVEAATRALISGGRRGDVQHTAAE